MNKPRKIAAKTTKVLSAPKRTDPGYAQAPIIPADSVVRRALVFVIAAMCLLACLALAIVLTAHRSTERWAAAISEEITVQLAPSDAIAREEQMTRALEILRGTPGIDRANPADEVEIRELLEPWLGSDADLEALPVPAMIVIDIQRGSPPDMEALALRLSQAVPGAVLDDHRFWLERLRTGGRIVVWIGGGLFVLVLCVMVACVVFATRAAVSTNRDIVEVLHLVGARESFIAGEFQRHFLVMGLKAGMAGGAGAIVMLFVTEMAVRRWLHTGEGANARLLLGDLSFDFVAFAGVIGIVFLVAILSAVTSRLAVHRFLGEGL